MSTRCQFVFLVVVSVMTPVFDPLTVVTAGEVHIALNDGLTEKALSLLKKDPTLIDSRNDSQETPLHVAVHRGRTEAVKWLLANKANVNAVAYNTFTPLHLAQDGE